MFLLPLSFYLLPSSSPSPLRTSWEHVVNLLHCATGLGAQGVPSNIFLKCLFWEDGVLVKFDGGGGGKMCSLKQIRVHHHPVSSHPLHIWESRNSWGRGWVGWGVRAERGRLEE